VVRVDKEHAGLRLDQFLAAVVPDLSRRKARVALQIGGVFVDRKRAKVASRPVQEGQQVAIHEGGALKRALEAGQKGPRHKAANAPEGAAKQRAAAQIVYEDADIVVVNKPAGLLTAPTAESDQNNLANDLSKSCPQGSSRPRGTVWVVHRLDLQTSGLLVFGLTPAANKVLSEMFRVHDVLRCYQAIVKGRFPVGVKKMDAPLSGKRAVTHIEEAVQLSDDATSLLLRLETGRTHQIRLHCRAEGHPVWGDPSEPFSRTASRAFRSSGRREAERAPEPPLAEANPREAKISWPRPPRMALHAARFAFRHPRTKKLLTFEAPLPEDLSTWLKMIAPDAPPLHLREATQSETHGTGSLDSDAQRPSPNAEQASAEGTETVSRPTQDAES